MFHFAKIFFILLLTGIICVCHAQINFLTQGTINLTPTSTPTGGSATATGGTGTTWTYVAVEISGTGLTGASDPFSVSGPAVLSGTNYITLHQPCAAPGDTIQFYRTVASGTPSSTGKIGSPISCTTGTATLTDNGLVGDGSNSQFTNTTGQLSAANIANIRYASSWCTIPGIYDISCIANAVSSLGGQPGTVALAQNELYTVVSNYTIPATVTLAISNGTQIAPTSGITLTILGPLIASDYQIFNGTGLISFNGNNNIHETPLSWFGGVPDGITDNNGPWNDAIATACASTSSSTQFLISLGRGDYTDSQPVWLNCSNIGIKGAGKYATTLSELTTSLISFPVIRVAMPFESGYGINSEMFVPSLVPGPGNAVQFSSTNQGPAIRLDSDPDIDKLNGLSAFTADFFINVKSTVNGTNLLSMWGNDYATQIGHRAFQIYMNSSQALCANLTTTSGGYGFCSANDSITLNTVHHIAMSYDGTTIRLFVDGNLVASQAASGAIVRDREEGLFLANAECGNEFLYSCSTNYDGVLDIDSVRISNYARFTAPFTPPTSKSTWDSNDIILVNFDQINSDGSAFYAQTFDGSGGRIWLPFINVGAGGTQFMKFSGFSTSGGNFGMQIWNNDHSSYHDIATVNAYVGIDAELYIFYEKFQDIRSTGAKRSSVILGGGGGDNYLANWYVEGGDYEMCLAGSDYHANHIWITDTTNQGCSGYQCSSVEEALQIAGNASLDATGLVIDDENLRSSDHLVTQIANYSSPVEILGGWIGTGDAVSGSIPVITRLSEDSMTFVGTAFYGSFSGQPEVVKVSQCDASCWITLQNPTTNWNTSPTKWSNMPSVTDVIMGPQHSIVLNDCSGTATLVAGTITVSNPCILGSRPISLSENTSGAPNALGYTQSSSTLVITSSSPTDTSVVSWVQN